MPCSSLLSDSTVAYNCRYSTRRRSVSHCSRTTSCWCCCTHVQLIEFQVRPWPRPVPPSACRLRPAPSASWPARLCRPGRRSPDLWRRDRTAPSSCPSGIGTKRPSTPAVTSIKLASTSPMTEPLTACRCHSQSVKMTHSTNEIAGNTLSRNRCKCCLNGVRIREVWGTD